jgi:hypothetical protein
MLMLKVQHAVCVVTVFAGTYCLLRLRAVQVQKMPARLQAELADLERFCTTRFFGQMAEPLQPVTYRTVTKHYVK